MITRLAPHNYFEPVAPVRNSWEEPGSIGYKITPDFQEALAGTDVFALRVKREVSVTPLSLDMTSRVDFGQLERLINLDKSRESNRSIPVSK
jgi:5'-nucleotidase